MLEKTLDVRALLDKARGDLQATEAELAVLESEKSAASGSREAFEAWRSDHAAATAEKERLTLLTATLEADIARSEVADAEEAWRERYSAQEAVIPKLAQRIREDLTKANDIITSLLEDVAKSTAEIQAINANLPDGLAPLPSADALARTPQALPRQEISRRRVLLWVRAGTNDIVGDQDAVSFLDNGRGLLHPSDRRTMAELAPRSDAGRPISCERRWFEEIEFHPAQAAQIRIVPLSSVRLVLPDAPGVEYDGAELRQPHQVLAALERAALAREPRERPIETELVPVGPPEMRTLTDH